MYRLSSEFLFQEWMVRVWCRVESRVNQDSDEDLVGLMPASTGMKGGGIVGLTPASTVFGEGKRDDEKPGLFLTTNQQGLAFSPAPVT